MQILHLTWHKPKKMYNPMYLLNEKKYYKITIEKT